MMRLMNNLFSGSAKLSLNNMQNKYYKINSFTRFSSRWSKLSKMQRIKLTGISVLVCLTGGVVFIIRMKLDQARRAPEVPLELLDTLDVTHKYIAQENFDTALAMRHECYQKAQTAEITDEFKYYAKKCFVGTDIKMGDLAFKLGKFDQAEGFYFSAFKVIREIEEPGSNCMIEITLRMIPILIKKSMVSEAQEGYQSCLNWLYERKDSMNERDISLFSNVYHDYGLFLAHFARHKSAVECIDKAIFYLEKLTGVTDDMRIYLGNLKAVILLDGSHFDEAIECFTEMLELAESARLASLAPIILFNLASAHARRAISDD